MCTSAYDIMDCIKCNGSCSPVSLPLCNPVNVRRDCMLVISAFVSQLCVRFTVERTGPVGWTNELGIEG